MPIKDVMTRGVEVIAPEARLIDAAAKMADGDIGFLPVCDGEWLVGAVTDRDITVRATAKGLDAKTTLVREVMSQDVAYGFEDEDIAITAQRMKKLKLRRVLIVDRNKRLVGVVSLGDLATEQESQSSEVLEQLSDAPPGR